MKIIILICLLLLASCAGYGTFKAAVAEEGAKAADEALDAAIWHICKASPVGAIKRRFKSAQEIAAYNILCPDGFIQGDS